MIWNATNASKASFCTLPYLTNPKHISHSVSIYWDYALTVPLRQIVCIHCHQRREYAVPLPQYVLIQSSQHAQSYHAASITLY